MIDAPRNCDPPRRQERWCRQRTLVVCHRIKLVNGPAGGFGGNRARRLVEARCRLRNSPKGAVEGRPPRGSGQGCPVARLGVCNETGRNSEPEANPAETLATHNSTHLRDTTLAAFHSLIQRLPVRNVHECPSPVKAGQRLDLSCLAGLLEAAAQGRLDHLRQSLTLARRLLPQAFHHAIVNVQSRLHMENHMCYMERCQSQRTAAGEPYLACAVDLKCASRSRRADLGARA